jgi:predicted nucleic acid-binding protein
LASLDVAAALRWARMAQRRTLARRPDNELPFLSAVDAGGQPLLLDTRVYIDQMQGRAPKAVEQLIDVRQVNHSTIAIQELMHTLGALDPADRRTASVVKVIRAQIEAMPEHRIFTPDAEVLGRAALLAGIISRMQGYACDARLKALHDCVLFLQAQKLGFSLLTANISDFDLLLQLVPSSRALFYRAVH